MRECAVGTRRGQEVSDATDVEHDADRQALRGQFVLRQHNFFFFFCLNVSARLSEAENLACNTAMALKASDGMFYWKGARGQIYANMKNMCAPKHMHNSVVVITL